MITLIIKGNRNQAESALLAHNMAAVFVENSGFDNPVFMVDNHHQMAVYQWFNEDLGDEVFKPGSLLWFSDHKNSPIKEETIMT